MKDIVGQIVKKRPIAGAVIMTLVLWFIGTLIPAMFIHLRTFNAIMLLTGGLLFYAFVSFSAVGLTLHENIKA